MASSSTPSNDRVAARAGAAADDGTSQPKAPEATAGPSSKFKMVRVRKPDGSIVTVKRPVEGDVEKAAASAASTGNAGPSTKSTPRPGNFKIVTVRKPDGTFVKVRRPVKPGDGESAAAANVPAPNAALAGDEKSKGDASEPAALSRQQTDAITEKRQNDRTRKRRRFKRVLAMGLMRVGLKHIPGLEIGDMEQGDQVISDDDISGDDMSVDGGNDGNESMGTAAAGGLATALAANAASRPPPRSQPRSGGNAGNVGHVDKNKEKITYNLKRKDIEEMERKAAEEERPLSRHWANFSFYLLASLSITLPLLLLALGCTIIGMNQKDVTSSWSRMEDAIKVGVSAWPIVFAAVVAQCFKSWATYKVERGIKLMELEQLLGSNSVAMAVKQPFSLRRLDLLTLGILVIWSLSPLGSQALQRSYKTGRKQESDNPDVFLVDTTGYNQIWSPNWNTSHSKVVHEEYIQVVASNYISGLSPRGIDENLNSDEYGNPYLRSMIDRTYTSEYGLQVLLPDTKLVDAYTDEESKEPPYEPPYEHVQFNKSASYWSLSCANWTIKNRRDINDVFGAAWSSSQTMGLALRLDENSFMQSLKFASRNLVDNGQLEEDSFVPQTPDPNWEYSYIECDVQQIFVDVAVQCSRDPSTSYFVPFCRIDPNATVSTSEFNGTRLFDFSEQFTQLGSPNTNHTIATPSERYIETERKYDGLGYDVLALNLSINTTSPLFARRMSYLLNSWVGLGYCPECLGWSAASQKAVLDAANGPLSSHYVSQKGKRNWSQNVVYKAEWAWIGVFLAIVGILLLAGIISIVVESLTIAPDVLGYVSTAARNSRYLQLPKTTSAMGGGERAKYLGAIEVMMQDVKANADVGKIALGRKHDKAERLRAGRLYR